MTGYPPPEAIQTAARAHPRFTLTVSEQIKIVIDGPDGDVELRIDNRVWSLPRGTAFALASGITSALAATRKRD
jgi:hypothetical protein